jgi:hypothetical protein
LHDLCLILRSYGTFILSLPIAFLLIASGLARARTGDVFVPTLLFVTAGLISLFSFRSSKNSLLPVGSAFRQIEIEHTEIEKLIRKLEEHPTNGLESTEKIFHDLYRSFLNIANSGSTIISSEASAACAVSVKLLWREADGDITVRRFIRDSNSRRQRVSAPEGFSWFENTAFRSIALGQEQDYFVSDNLSLLEAQGKYSNVNKHWSELYNSTAVAPI